MTNVGRLKEFDKLCCAYRHHRSSKVARATLSWFVRDIYGKLENTPRLTVSMPPALLAAAPG